jgi:hypothetical protein
MAFALISISLFVGGAMSASAVMFFEYLKSGDANIIAATQISSILFMIIPSYNLAMAINRLCLIYTLKTFSGKFLGL